MTATSARAVILECHTFYAPDDYECGSIEDAVSLAKHLVRNRKAYPTGIKDGCHRWDLHLVPNSDEIIAFQQVQL